MRRVVCGWRRFCHEVSEKRIYCFGAGKESVLFMLLLSEIGLTDKIVAFVDNAEKLIGTVRMVEGKHIPIISPRELIDIIKDDVVLITCSDICGVYEQLDTYEELESNDCYSMHLMLSKTFLESEFYQEIKQTINAQIPKKIHYCWFGGGQMSDFDRKCIKSWHEKCPDYEIIEWNETNYDYTKNEYMFEAYLAGKWGFVSDYARLDIIYEQGGIYLDTDVELLKNPEELLYNDAFACFDIHFMVNTGCGFGASKGNQLVKEMRDYYQKIHFIDILGKYDVTTCLVHQVSVLKKHGLKLDGSFQKVANMTIYPIATIDGRDTYAALNHKNENVILRHYGEGSWVNNILKNARKRREECLSALLTRGSDGIGGQWVWR